MAAACSLRGRMRALLNDELSLQNRARALAAGFYATLAAALAVYVDELAAGDRRRRRASS